MSLLEFKEKQTQLIKTHQRHTSDRIEVGRWARPNSTPVDERKCRYCNKLEDEFHFLLECTLYEDLRKQYIKKYFWYRTNMLKLRELMSTKNRNIIYIKKKNSIIY